jgi:ribonuclease P protein component
MADSSSNEEERKDVRACRYALQPSKYDDVMFGFRSASFPKEARLRKRTEFLQLLNSQHKSSLKGFLVVWRENTDSIGRLGITASKKIGSAVVRNRVKRYIREIFRHNRLSLVAVDINVIARHESVQMNYFEVQRELNKAFRLIGVSTCSRALCSL